MPTARWAPFEQRSPQERGILRAATRSAAYLDDVEGFDAAFFGISPLEARYLDPQQRLALEVAWEALEHAGMPPSSLRGTDTGVYMGVAFGEYGMRTMADLTDIAPWAGLGTADTAEHQSCQRIAARRPVGGDRCGMDVLGRDKVLLADQRRVHDRFRDRPLPAGVPALDLASLLMAPCGSRPSRSVRCRFHTCRPV